MPCRDGTPSGGPPPRRALTGSAAPYDEETPAALTLTAPGRRGGAL
ncbi:hypothetical protein [Streptosporangium canum]